MFDKPFEQLFRALERIENQLTVADQEQKQLLREELIALRSVSDRFVEKWLIFEEKMADLSDFFDLGMEMVQPSMPGAKATSNTDLSALPYSFSPISQVGDTIQHSFRMGLGYFDLLMFPDAIRELERVVEMDGDFAIARVYLALGYFGQHVYEKALQQLNLVAVGQNDPLVLSVVHHTLGQIYAAQGDYVRAAEEFKQTAAYSRDFADAYYNLGICQYHEGQMKDALASFLKVLEFDETDWEAQQIVSLLWQKLGVYDKAHRHMEQAFQVNSSNFGLLMQFADLSQQLGELDLASSLYDRVRRFYPTRVEPLGGLGWIELRKGNVKEAMAYYKKQLSLDPRDPQANFNYGWLLLMQGEVSRAETIFHSLSESYPSFEMAQMGLARVYQIQDQWEKANHLLHNLIHSSERSIRKIGHLQLGRWAVERGEFQQAIEQFQSALQLDHSSKEAWYYKGIAHSGLGQKEEANECFSHCK